MISDRGNRCRRLFFEVFAFPLCKAQFLGDGLDNRRGAPNCSVRLCFQNSYIFVNLLCSVRHYNGVGDIGALILMAQGGLVRAPIIFKICFADFFSC